MNCERATELLSDDLEGTLDGVLAAELATHLRGCSDCRALRAAMADVAALLETPALEPAADLADRVARATWPVAGPRLVRAERARAWGRAVAAGAGWLSEVPFAVQALAASFALALTAGLVMAASGTPGTAPRPRVSQRFSDATVYVVERKDRLVEDFRLLRVVVATAFEGRLDRLNDRMDDYRRLLERRRLEQSNSDKPEASGKKSEAAPQTSEPRASTPRTSVTTTEEGRRRAAPHDKET
jgi:hypothetical protein